MSINDITDVYHVFLTTRRKSIVVLFERTLQ